VPCPGPSSLGEFAQGTDAEIFNPYVALQAWAGTPAEDRDDTPGPVQPKTYDEKKQSAAMAMDGD
jgi:hypothetical protein